jgi:hypothetical protein
VDVIKGGTGKPGKRPTRQAKPEPKVKIIREKEVEASELPKRIEVERTGLVQQIVPSSVWRCGAFKWDAEAFALESDELNEKFFEPTVQDRSLVRFLKAPLSPMIYGVTGNPDDQKAKLFAAFLVEQHCKRAGSDANPWWITLTGGFDNPWLDRDKRRPTMIVLTNLTAQSTAHKLEKARDIIETYPKVPIVVCGSGMDPVSFLSTKLRVPVNAIAYFCESIVKRRVEIV